MKLCRRVDESSVRRSIRHIITWPGVAGACLALLICCLSILTIPGTQGNRNAEAYCYKDSCNTACSWDSWYASGQHWYESQMPIKYYINKDGATSHVGDEFRAVQNAAANWESLNGTFWATCYGDTTSKHSSADHGSPERDTLNIVSWEDMGGGNPLPLGYGYVWYSTTGDSCVEADMTLNNNAAVQWSALTADSCVPGKYDVENIATHEFGHWMYLGHSCDTAATMYCYGKKDEIQKRTLEQCDLEAMQWRYTQNIGDPKPQPGCWPLAFDDDLNTNPVLGDVNRDGREEIVLATRDGKISVVSGRGKKIYSWAHLGATELWGAPALGDINSDNWLEIAIGSMNDSVYVFTNVGARVANWPQGTGASVKSTPAIADLDKDGNNEIICASGDSCVYAWRGSTGNKIAGWPVKLGASILYAGPAVADLDGDDSLEVIITGNDNKVYALKPHGAALTGWPVSTGRIVQDRVAVGDIDGDSQFEVVATAVSDSVYAWNADGSRCAGWPVRIPSSIGYSEPSLGDIDGDSSPEVLFGSESDSVYAFNGNGSRVTGWPRYVDGKVLGTALAVDIDNDFGYEVIAVTDKGKIYAFNGNGTTVGGWPKTYGGSGYSRSPVIGDANGDGELDIFVGSTSTDKLYAYSLGSVVGNNTYAWRMYGHDWNRTSRFGYAPAAPPVILFGDLIANLDHWQRWGMGGASISLSTMNFSPPYSMGVSGSPSPGAYAGAFSEYVDANFARPYSLKFYFAYNNFYAANWIVFGHARFRLVDPYSPVMIDMAGDWSSLVPIGPPFGSYCPPGVFTEFEVTVDPATRIVMLFVNGAPMGTGMYNSTVVPSNRVWLEDREGSGQYLTGWYDDFEVRGYPALLGVEEASPTPQPANVLYQSYPNPMNPMATIKYSVKESGRVVIRVYDVAGRVIKELVNADKQASLVPYSIVWNGTDDFGRRVASGVYFCLMEAKNFTSSKKIVILR